MSLTCIVFLEYYSFRLSTPVGRSPKFVKNLFTVNTNQVWKTSCLYNVFTFYINLYIWNCHKICVNTLKAKGRSSDVGGQPHFQVSTFEIRRTCETITRHIYFILRARSIQLVMGETATPQIHTSQNSIVVLLSQWN